MQLSESEKKKQSIDKERKSLPIYLCKGDLLNAIEEHQVTSYCYFCTDIVV